METQVPSRTIRVSLDCSRRGFNYGQKYYDKLQKQIVRRRYEVDIWTILCRPFSFVEEYLTLKL